MIALLSLGVPACAPRAESNAESQEALRGAPFARPVGPAARFGAERISAVGPEETVTVWGSGFTSSGRVFIGSWDGHAWVAGTWIVASRLLPCDPRSARYCRPGEPFCCPGGTRCEPPGRCSPTGRISGSYRNQCSETVTVFGYDADTGTFSNGVEVFVTCIS